MADRVGRRKDTMCSDACDSGSLAERPGEGRGGRGSKERGKGGEGRGKGGEGRGRKGRGEEASAVSCAKLEGTLGRAEELGYRPHPCPTSETSFYSPLSNELDDFKSWKEGSQGKSPHPGSLVEKGSD